MGLFSTDKGVVGKVVGDSDLPHLLLNAAKTTVQNAIDQQAGNPTPKLSTNGHKPFSGIAKPGLIVAGAAAGVTAASAAISAARRRSGDE